MNGERRNTIDCAATAIEFLQGKWKVHILYAMRGGPVRLGQLTRQIPLASKKMLMTDLKKLVSSGLAIREDLSDNQMVRHVEYDLVEPMKAATFLLLEQLEHWEQVRQGINADALPTQRSFTQGVPEPTGKSCGLMSS